MLFGDFMPKRKDNSVNLKDLFNKKRIEVNKGQWESINKIPLELLKDMVFTVKTTEVNEVETGFGYTPSFTFEKDGIEYRLLTKSKVFMAIWKDNIQENMNIKLGKDDNGWYMYE